MKNFQFFRQWRIRPRRTISNFQFLLLIILLILPLVSFAHRGGQAAAPNLPYWGPLLSCGSGTCDRNQLIHTLLHIVYFAITMALYVAAPIFFAWGGIMILISGSNPGGMEQGKKIITGTVIGVLITLSSFLIVETFVGFTGIQGVGGF